MTSGAVFKGERAEGREWPRRHTYCRELLAAGVTEPVIPVIAARPELTGVSPRPALRVPRGAARVRACVLHVERPGGGAGRAAGGGVGLHRQLLHRLGGADGRHDRRLPACAPGVRLVLRLHEGEPARCLGAWGLSLWWWSPQK